MMDLSHLLALVLVASLIKADTTDILEYTIAPTMAQCLHHPPGGCFTLSQLPSRLEQLDSDKSVLLSFLQGEHLLTNRMRIENLLGITFKDDNDNISNSPVVINCKSLRYAGFHFENITTLKLEGISFQNCSNINSSGGALYITATEQLTIYSCSFRGNTVFGDTKLQGGAVYIKSTQHVHISQSIFTNNFLKCNSNCTGGAVYIAMPSSIQINLSNFMFNAAIGNGGAMGLDKYYSGAPQSMEIINSSFVSNNASQMGGAIILGIGDFKIRGSLFKNNSAKSGGAVYGFDSIESISNITSENSSYTSNRASTGGAIYVGMFSFHSYNNTYDHNSALKGGGAVHTVVGKAVKSSGDVFIYNSCQKQGGAIFNNRTQSNITGALFSGNIAYEGAAIYQLFQSTMEISNTSFTSNGDTSLITGTVHIELSTVMFSGSVKFWNNNGTIYSLSSEVKVRGNLTISSNRAQTGGAITCSQSRLTFETQSMTNISRNKANYGGGLYLSQCITSLTGKLVIDSNEAIGSDDSGGGGIFAFQSKLDVNTFSDSSYILSLRVNITRNRASRHGGGIFLSASNLQVSDTYIHFNENTADGFGGGAFLTQASTMSLEKRQYSNDNLKLIFSNNTAQNGGALFISDETNAGELCGKPSIQSTAIQGCFLQTYYYNYYNYVNVTLTTFFSGNRAEQRGNDIYGGLLDRCKVDPTVDILVQKSKHQSLNGLQYLQATASFDGISDIFNNKTELSMHISSDPVKVCFCTEDNTIDCNYTQPVERVKKGKEFKLILAAVDQTERPLNSTIFTSIQPAKGGLARLKEGQESQHISDRCSVLTLNVYSSNNSATLQLYAEGPCSDHGLSVRHINISFLDCIVPIGFQRAQPLIDCKFTCDYRLLAYISNCSVEDNTVQIVKPVWIEYVDTSNTSGYVVQNCPYDFCHNKPLNVSLNETSEQCAFNRTGKLCGKCKDSLSQVLGTSRCLKCSNYWILLLLPFIAAGIALVAFLLLLNITIDTGALNGLLLYANILAGNYSTYYPYSKSTVLTVFISWLNLDLGIETCFYNGMDSQMKVFLQLLFPIYIFGLMGTIIILANCSQRVTNWLEGVKLIETLCTLVILSYSKLLQSVIVIFQSINLVYPNGSYETVWQYDASIGYWSAQPWRIILLLSAMVIIILGTVYTSLLLFGQWLQHESCTRYRVFQWLNSPRYTTVINVYREPFVESHRYWLGLLLLARIVHHLISAFTSTSVQILTGGVIAFTLLLLKFLQAYFNRAQMRYADKKYIATYKRGIIELLEVSFLINLGLLAFYTLYEIAIDQSLQYIVFHISTAICFTTFLFIIVLCMHGRGFYATKIDWVIAQLSQLVSKLKFLLVRITERLNLCKRNDNILDEVCNLPPHEQLMNFDENTVRNETRAEDNSNDGSSSIRNQPWVDFDRPSYEPSEREPLLAYTQESVPTRRWAPPPLETDLAPRVPTYSEV